MYRVRLHKGMAFLQIFNHHLVWPPSSIDTLHKRGVQSPVFILCRIIICPEQNTGCCIENYTLYETARHIAGQSARDPLMPNNYVIRFVIGDAGKRLIENDQSANKKWHTMTHRLEPLSDTHGETDDPSHLGISHMLHHGHLTPSHARCTSNKFHIHPGRFSESYLL